MCNFATPFIFLQFQITNYVNWEGGSILKLKVESVKVLNEGGKPTVQDKRQFIVDVRPNDDEARLDVVNYTCKLDKVRNESGGGAICYQDPDEGNIAVHLMEDLVKGDGTSQIIGKHVVFNLVNDGVIRAGKIIGIAKPE